MLSGVVLALGLLTPHIQDAESISEALSMRSVEHVMVGPQRWEFYSNVRSGGYVYVDLGGLADGRIQSRRVLEKLQARSIDVVINGGTLTGLLDAVLDQRVVRRFKWPAQKIEKQRQAALKLADTLTAGRIRVEWLADHVPEVRAGRGLLNGVPLPLDGEVIDQAVARARAAAKNSSVATCVFDGGPGNTTLAYDTDEKLKLLASLAAPLHTRLMIKVAPNAAHSPLDPPMFGPPTVELAKQAHVRAIAIEASRGIIMSRSETLRMAEAAGIAVIGV